MKRKKALELRQAWGDRPCPHPAFAKEYDLGERTGNFICTQCGRTFSVREKVAITRARKETDAPSGAADAADAADAGHPPADRP